MRVWPTTATNDNLGNGIFIHYLNGGIFRSVSEDLDGDGILDAGEDLNGNGRMDQGIVSNTSSNNGIAGICIFGENASEGIFDIGGPNAITWKYSEWEYERRCPC